MNNHATHHRTPATRNEPAASLDPEGVPAWVPLVIERVQTLRYGVVQIVVHDSRVVQIERTERSRLDLK